MWQKTNEQILLVNTVHLTCPISDVLALWDMHGVQSINSAEPNPALAGFCRCRQARRDPAS